MEVNVIVLVYQKLKFGRAGIGLDCTYMSLEATQYECAPVTWAFHAWMCSSFSLS